MRFAENGWAYCPDVYDACCDQKPKVVESVGGKWSAECYSCGNTVEARDPVGLMVAWNKQQRTKKE